MNIKCDQCGRFTPKNNSRCLACGNVLRDFELEQIYSPPPIDNSDSAYIAWLKSKGYPIKYFIELKDKSVEALKEIFRKKCAEKPIITNLRDKWR